MALPDPLTIAPLDGPLDADVHLPGSKSITNRALVCAALATGSSELRGRARSRRHPGDGRRAAGARRARWRSDWADGRARRCRAAAAGPPSALAVVDARLSGTTSRFLLPVAALGAGTYRIDGAAALRSRPMGDVVEAIRALGGQATDIGAPGHLPVEVHGGPAGRRGRHPARRHLQPVPLRACCWPGRRCARGCGSRWRPTSSPGPTSDMTVAVMRRVRGRRSTQPGRPRRGPSCPRTYQATRFAIEPDASAASYFFAAAAIAGGRVTVHGLGQGSLQGDLARRRPPRADGSDGGPSGRSHHGHRHRRAPRDRRRPLAAVRRGPDARGRRRLRRRAQPLHAASASSGARRPTASATSWPSWCGRASTPSRSPTAT